ncbi:TerC family protein [Fodinisporobacter ferrooxydans]|uniref:TerC family protein n=1 Tax=Fodinisporobacter ferrooxydans TaxID=2901836 RepID=A0ABY4CQ85_9BACL|nr:TerC family protein [Alicyclobacillaceae bacterium MYW30-H2]
MVSWLIILASILLVNLVLSADNAIVIAMATMRLEERQRGIAMWLGTAASIVLRIVMTGAATILLQYPYIQALGGALLFYIAIKLLIHVDGGKEVHTGTTFFRAVISILLADLTMSLDNVLAVAALAQGHFVLLVVGLFLSIVCIVMASRWIVSFMDRYIWITYIGAGVLGWTAGAMVAKDNGFTGLFPHAGWLPLLCFGVMLILGIMRQVGFKWSN